MILFDIHEFVFLEVNRAAGRPLKWMAEEPLGKAKDTLQAYLTVQWSTSGG